MSLFRRTYTASSRFTQTVAYSSRLNGPSVMEIRDHYFLLFLAGIMKLFFVTLSLSVITECCSQWQQQALTEQYQTCLSWTSWTRFSRLTPIFWEGKCFVAFGLYSKGRRRTFSISLPYTQSWRVFPQVVRRRRFFRRALDFLECQMCIDLESDNFTSQSLHEHCALNASSNRPLHSFWRHLRWEWVGGGGGQHGRNYSKQVRFPVDF